DHLHSGVIDIVACLNVAPHCPEHPYHRVPNHGVAHMADVHRLVGIHIGVLDQYLPAIRSAAAERRSFLEYRIDDGTREGLCLDPEVDEPGRGDGDLLDVTQTLAAQPSGELLGDLQRLTLLGLRQLERRRGAEVADLRLRRPVELYVRYAEPLKYDGR